MPNFPPNRRVCKVTLLLIQPCDEYVKKVGFRGVTIYIHIYIHYIHIIYTYCREDSPRRSPLASSRSDAGDPQHSAEGNAAADPGLLDLGLQGAGQGEVASDVLMWWKGVEGWSPRGWWKGELMLVDVS